MEAIGITANLHKAEALEIAKKLIGLCEDYNLKVHLTIECASLLGKSDMGYSMHEIADMSDILVVLGGDGTLLKVAREFFMADIPILGINLGHIGFLAEVEMSDLEPSMERILKGDYEIEERLMLSSQVIRNGEVAASFHSLNDMVVSKGPFSRIIMLEAYVNDQLLETYPGDGVIVASPTGSTAYSLSAGGPIVNPNLNVLIVTPICPHMLHHRSVIISEKEVVHIKVFTQQAEVILTVDGQHGFQLKNNDEIIIQKSEHSTKLVKVSDVNFYALLHRKLRER